MPQAVLAMDDYFKELTLEVSFASKADPSDKFHPNKVTTMPQRSWKQLWSPLTNRFSLPYL